MRWYATIIKTPMSLKWKTYYEQTEHAPPSPLLVSALPYVEHRGKAIDIGGGALKDTRYLLAQGFDVTVLDKEESLAEMADAIGNHRLHAVVTSFDEYAFPQQAFDLASAMFSLPFNPPHTFEQVFSSIKDSLVQGGIFCGQFFGDRDEWASNTDMTFHAKEEIERLLSDLQVIELDEREYRANLASGLPKHWHLFQVIARKR